jgi:hypothetical protein
MATVAAVIASTHHPFYLKASTATGAERPPFADEWQAKIEAFRETLTRAEPDVLVMVGSDHFHQLWLDNMPQFLVGKAPYFDDRAGLHQHLRAAAAAAEAVRPAGQGDPRDGRVVGE